MRAAFDPTTVRADLAAGAVSAALTLPQSIVFANLAGVPPQYGIYTAVFATIIAALWGSSRHLLSGPNTAMSLLMGTALAPFAAFDSHEYLALVAVVTLAVGLTQVLVGLVRGARVFTFVPAAVVDAFMAAVGIQIILSQIPYGAGITPVDWEPVWKGAVSALLAWRDFHPFSLIVFALTVVLGCALRRLRRARRFALPGALIAGLAGNELLIRVFGAARVMTYTAGHAAVRLFPASVPHPFEPENRVVLLHTLPAVLAIASIGLLQSALVARAAAEHSGQPVDLDQDAVAQGLANITVSFLSGFAAGGSVNRSKANQDAGACTPMAAVYSGILILLAALALPGVIASIPVPAMAGLLVLVGASLIHPRDVLRLAQRNRRQAALYLVILAIGVFVGLTVAVVAGFALPVLYYLARSSAPTLQIDEHEDGHACIRLGGQVFFATTHQIARRLREIGEARGWLGRVVLDLHGIQYLDHDGETLLRREVSRWRERGGEVQIDAEDGIAKALGSVPATLNERPFVPGVVSGEHSKTFG